jgi:hypothetical protein
MPTHFENMDVIDGMHAKFNSILQIKNKQLHESYEDMSKRKKMISGSNIDDVPFNAKSTLAKIRAEQERKLKSSKAYKKKTEASGV